MRILLYTDNHWCTTSSVIRGRGSKYSIRLENQIQSINWAESLVKEYGCDKVIHLGDFFDKPDLSSEELTALKDIKWADKDHYFLVGNHEMGNQDLTFNSMNALSKVGKVINKPELMSIFGCDIILLPYVVGAEKPSLKSIIDNLYMDTFSTQELKNRIILSHNDICGIRYGQWESKVGFDIEEINNCCNLFINGHLHNQQQVNDKIFNLGNLTGQNFSEDAFKYSHCAAILDTNTLQINCIVNPYAFQFYKVEVNNINQFKEIIERLDKENNVIITIKTPFDISDKVKEQLSTCNFIYSRVLIDYSKQHIDKEVIEKIDLDIDYISKFKKFIEEKYSDGSVNLDIMIKELQKIGG